MNLFLRSFSLPLLFSFIFFFQSNVFAQTFTPKYNVSMTEHSKGYYEYLPEGYNSGNEKYPLLIFFHGAGEKGDGSAAQLSRVLANGTPKQINTGTFPKSFTVNGNTYKFIVIAPQITDSPVPSDVDNILNYVIAHYRVDTLRIYLTGLSMGGGVVWEYPGESFTYASRISAIVPVCGAAWPANFRCENIAADNLPVWATHNNGDGTVPVSYTTGFVNGINSQNPPPNPRAKMTIFNSTSHDAWTATYDLNFKEDGLNVYEWMLQFAKKSVLPVNDLQFKIAKEKNGVAINWSTASEVNNYGFIVERSNDSRRFDSIAFIPSSGASAHQYKYVDNAPSAGENYYRLKIIATTGQTTYSEVRNILYPVTKSISLFPNPVNNVLHIQSGNVLTKATLRITDMSGKIVLANSISGIGDHSVQVKLVPGMYVATIIQDGKVIFSQSFIKK